MTAPEARVTAPEAGVTTAAALRVENLVVRRGGRTVIDRLALHVDTGEVVGGVGKNGCGKSTLLMAIAGVLAPTDGRSVVAGASVWGSTRERTRARTALGYVPEGADAPGFLRGSELWALCAAARHTTPPSPALAEQLGLDEVADLALERMSLGQRRRAALARLPRSHAAAGHAPFLSTHDTALLDQIGARVVPLA